MFELMNSFPLISIFGDRMLDIRLLISVTKYYYVTLSEGFKIKYFDEFVQKQRNLNKTKLDQMKSLPTVNLVIF